MPPTGREDMMNLTLTGDDARTLRDLLSEYLRDLRLETARTEVKDFRHVLVLRQELIERLLAQLERNVRT